MSNLIRGTFILTLASTISRILGFIYIVPFTFIVGTNGYILFEYGYKPYILMISISTMGVPLAMSKFVAKYNELGDYRTSNRLFKSGLVVMGVTGLIAFTTLYFSAPYIAELLVDGSSKTGNHVSDVIYVIKMVSFALLIIPIMSLMRGYFQGFESMGPTAVSQVIEQIVRIMFILLMSFIIIYINSGEISKAVGFATFGAFIGGLAGLVILVIYYVKRRSYFKEKINSSKNIPNLSLVQMYKELVTYAIPFVIIGLALPLFQIADTFIINAALTSSQVGYELVEAERVNSIIALVQKVILIPVSLATAFGLTLVPAITKSYTSKKWVQLKGKIKKILQIIIFLIVPSCIGLSLLGKPIFVMLFGLQNADLGGYVMTWHAPTSLLFALFIVTAAILQGVNKQKEAVVSLFLGFSFKLLTNYFFIVLWGSLGAIISTNIGFLISIAINFYIINKVIGFGFHEIKEVTLKVFQFGFIMAMLLLIINELSDAILTSSDYTTAIINVIVGVCLGAFSYIILSYKFGTLSLVFGDNVEKLFEKISVRKKHEG